MKKILLVLLSAGVLVTTGCSRSDKPDTVAKPQSTPESTPDVARLKSDSERLQKATANAAKAREDARENAATASPTPAATASP
jgi:outer membrane murein-binding lipoprotein Lpp